MKFRFKPLSSALLLAFATIAAAALFAPALRAAEPVSKETAATIMTLFPNGRGDKWNYDEGTALEGMDKAWFATSDGAYFNYIQHCVDRFVGADGSIATYKPDEMSLDNVLMGRQLLLLYNVTGQEKYYKAATQIYDQLKRQPRIPEGGFWHKKRYPEQMWLDGLYMAEPFYAEYAQVFHHTADFDDVVKQFELMERHARDPKTGLLYHGWDESRQQRWADKSTGDSPSMWSRAMGWYAMGLVDTLDYLPQDYAGRASLIAMLNRFAAAIVVQQDPDTGVWYQVTDKRRMKGNYGESSASSMFVYVLAKGVRKGYLPRTYMKAAQKGYDGIRAHFVSTDAKGALSLAGTADSVGLGGEPVYRDGSYTYYAGVKQVTNDARGLGALLMASVEMEMAPDAELGHGMNVVLDSWFDAETKKDVTGTVIPFHYKWEEMDNNGYSFFAHAFHRFGVETRTLYAAPTAQNLAKADIYIIADPNFATTPDNPHYNPHPHYIQPQDAKAVVDWVRQGGVLLLFANDEHNSEFEHLNTLANQFGITFNKDIRNRVTGRQFEMGKLTIPEDNPIFKNAHTVYMKEICTFGIQPPAQAVVTDKGDNIVVMAKYGKGMVFAVGDPWVYNEYTDGRKLPGNYQNYLAAQDIVRWAVEHVPASAPQSTPAR
ncbi:MAG: DUF4350 domain-containing protein [Acidobacteriaceae bacterium]